VGREFLQAECETASINMVYGAAAAGRLAITASSGPGMSLMQEGLSYMAGAELPGVVVDIMRSGPGLGNVFPEQSDYNQAVKGGGHGNYRCVVLAPASVQEMCDLTIKAFEMAFAYRTPAVLLADGLLGQMMETLTLPARELPRPGTIAWSVQGNAATRRNLITSIFLDVNTQESHNLKLQAKYAEMERESYHECYLCDDAEIVLIGYGISSRIARTAAEALRAKGLRAGVFRPISLSPFPADALCRAVEGRKALVVEHSVGQFRDDVLFHLAREGRRYQEVGLVNRLGGSIVTVDEVTAAAERALLL
jgi:2-oxoisovalerate ferredoxin oxidoreductase alpha subunit